MIKNCLNTENTIDDGMFFLNKEFCANGISLRVKTGISLLDEKHLVDKTIEFSLRNWLSLRRLVSPWAVKKCFPIAEYLCSTMR